jgi:membrane-associated phospholipid phosphatase
VPRIIAALLLVSTYGFSQTNSPPLPSPPSGREVCGAKHLSLCVHDFGRDQVGIWTSPTRTKPRDLLWLAPFAVATGLALKNDQRALDELGIANGRIDVSKRVSAIGSPYTLIGVGSAFYLVGSAKRNSHLAETGRLSLEALANASVVDEAIKLSTNRERPTDGTGAGRFWPHGTRDYILSSSFPSGHAISTWAVARVIAEEYPNKFVRIGVYGAATAVSIARVTGRQHFPSDVVVGSTFGYLIGGYVFRHHHKHS